MLVKGIMSKINASVVTRLLYKITKLIGSDAVSRTIFSSVHKKFGGHLKYLVSGGAALSVETATILKTLGLYVLEGYGMTETAPMISFTRPGRRKVGYAGELLPNIEVKIAENGEITATIQVTSIATALIIGIVTNAILTKVENGKFGKEKGE